VKLLVHCGRKLDKILNKDVLKEVAKTIGNGYKCYVNTASGEVFAADEIDLDTRQGSDFQEFVPLEGPLFFKLMEDFVATIEDFEKQSDLMETLMYEQPFQNFKRKVYAIHLADEWIEYRTKKIVEILTK